jgi:hypothetical protein
VLAYAGYKDAYTNATGCTKTLGNFIRCATFVLGALSDLSSLLLFVAGCQAMYQAVKATNGYLTADRGAAYSLFGLLRSKGDVMRLYNVITRMHMLYGPRGIQCRVISSRNRCKREPWCLVNFLLSVWNDKCCCQCILLELFCLTAYLAHAFVKSWICNHYGFHCTQCERRTAV